MLSDTVQLLFSRQNSLSSGIEEMTSLAADLTAVSLAIFVVLPTFRSLIVAQGKAGFSEFNEFRRISKAFASVGAASAVFAIVVVVGIVGRHWPCRAIQYGQEVGNAAGALLFLIAIYVVWRSTAWSVSAGN